MTLSGKIKLSVIALLIVPALALAKPAKKQVQAPAAVSVESYLSDLPQENSRELKILFAQITDESKAMTKNYDGQSILSGTLNQEESKIHSEKIIQAADRIDAVCEEMKKSGARVKAMEIAKSIRLLRTVLAESEKLPETAETIAREEKNRRVLSQDILSEARKDDDWFARSLVTSASVLTESSRKASAAKKNPALRELGMQKDPLRWSSFTESYVQALSFIETHSASKAVELWIMAADYYSQAGQLFFEDLKSRAEKARTLSESQEKPLYPRRVIEATDAIMGRIASDRKILSTAKTELGKGFLYKANFSRQTESISASDQNLKNLEKDVLAARESAEKIILEARVADGEVKLFYFQSVNSFKAGNFKKATDDLQKANDTFIRKLDELQKDGDTLRELSDTLASHRQEMIDSHRPVFLGEMRQLKKNARTSYYAGNFNEASSYISKAESKRRDWAKLVDSELESDPELERLKDFVYTAIAIKEGREISVYDSKAPEMKQTLLAAGILYNEGEKAIKENRRSVGERILDESRDKVNLVKTYYPRNKDAGILGMKIERLLSPEQFSAMMKAKVETLSHTDFSSRGKVAQEAYSSLLDLQDLDPEYPGLKKIVFEAEISMGLRMRPQDPEKIRKAKQLAAEAKSILDRAERDYILLEQAKQKASQAAELNPDNSTAITVLDEIAMRTGMQSQVNLSDADEQLYAGAVSDLQNSKILEADAKLRKILQNSSNMRSAKVLKLKKRIEAQL